jgi:hypothetical protein
MSTDPTALDRKIGHSERMNTDDVMVLEARGNGKSTLARAMMDGAVASGRHVHQVGAEAKYCTGTPLCEGFEGWAT